MSRADSLRKVAALLKKQAEKEEREKIAASAHAARALLGLQRLRTSMGLPS